ADAIYRAPDAEFTGAEWLERLTRNLVRALRDEPILLVLDNFETNLKPQAEPGTDAEPLWACQDPVWDRCLTQLAAKLVGTPSRVLITCRRPLAALAGTACHRVLLGPLPASEAALYLHPQDWADLTENTIRLAYAERLRAAYAALRHQNMTTAIQAGSRALVYYVQAGAYDRLGGFASSVVTSTSDPRLLAGLLPHLEAAAEAAP